MAFTPTIRFQGAMKRDVSILLCRVCPVDHFQLQELQGLLLDEQDLLGLHLSCDRPKAFGMRS